MLLLVSVDAPPHEALRLIFEGPLGSLGGISSTLMAWVPLVLAAAGLVVTFAAGLWNIGVEGQIVMGAIAATGGGPHGARSLGRGPAPDAAWPGMLGGLLWGLLVGVLRVKGRVNEIFGGLGLDFVATGLVVYLVIGPVEAGGERLHQRHRPLPSGGLAAHHREAHGLLGGPGAGRGGGRPGLLPDAGHLLRAAAAGGGGQPPQRLPDGHLHQPPPAGGLRRSAAPWPGSAGPCTPRASTTSWCRRCRAATASWASWWCSSPASGPRWIAPIALFFAVISVGSTQLQLGLQLDSALGGVLQGVLVLFTLLAGGWQLRRAYRSRHGSEEGG